jgi:hypothetical protein
MTSFLFPNNINGSTGNGNIKSEEGVRDTKVTISDTSALFSTMFI